MFFCQECIYYDPVEVDDDDLPSDATLQTESPIKSIEFMGVD